MESVRREAHLLRGGIIVVWGMKFGTGDVLCLGGR